MECQLVVMEIPNLKFNYVDNSDIQGFRFVDLHETIRSLKKDERKIALAYHRIEFFAILVITKGLVNHNVDFKTIQLKQDDCLIITKGQVHAFDSEADYYGYLLIFSEEFLLKHITQSSLKKLLFLYQPISEVFIFNNTKSNQLLISLLSDGLSDNYDVKANQVGALLTIYLLNIPGYSFGLENHNRNQEYYLQFKKMLEQNYQNSRNAKDYADMINISYKHLNDICKYVVNCTAKVLIDDYIILEAKRQLVMSSLSVKEIAFSLGFDEVTNFRKYFTKHTKLTPNDFLRKIKMVTH